MRGIRVLAVDEETVPPRVLVETRHDAEIVLERFALALFQSAHQPFKRGVRECFGLFGSHIAPPVPPCGTSGRLRRPPPPASPAGQAL
jgi:hypothetical protein